MNQAPTVQNVPHGIEHEEVDPELLALPAPPKGERTWTVALLLFTAWVSLAMIFALRRDAAYAVSDAKVQELGELNAASEAVFVENAFVSGSGMVGAAHAIRYERPLASGSFRLMPLAGRPNVWVEVTVPAGAENVRFVPPSSFKGRFVKFDATGPKHRGLASAVRQVTGQDVPAGAWLLVDGDEPKDSRWAVMLVLMFAGFVVWNVVASAKLLKKVG